MNSSDDDRPKVQRAEKRSGVSRFHRFALRDGGISRDDAIKNVQKMIVKLKPTYLEWLEKDIQTLKEKLDLLKTDRLAREDSRSAYRQSCVIRDLGTTFGYGAITDIADSLCELLNRLEANGIRHDQAIEAHLRGLQIVGSADADALSQSVDSRLIVGLRAIVDKFPAAATNAAGAK